VQLARKRHHEAGVDTARQRRTDRVVGSGQTPAHGCVEKTTQALGLFLLGQIVARGSLRRPIE
jgi:hypothetical protein